MLIKNINKYINEYKNISPVFLIRVSEYMKDKSFDFKSKIEKISNRILNIKENTIKIVLYIIPEATPRPRLSLTSGKFYVKNSKTNSNFMELIVRNNNDILNLITTPCRFIVNTFLPIPKGFNKIDTILAEMGLIRPITKPDWDNLGKTYSDMIQKHLIIDDSIIIEGSCNKYYSLKPRVEILIHYKEEFDCKYNEKLIDKKLNKLLKRNEIQCRKVTLSH